MLSLSLNEVERKKNLLKARKMNDFRVWKQKRYLKRENIIWKANEVQNNVKQHTLTLREEEINQGNRKLILKKKNVRGTNGIYDEQFSEVSERSQRYLIDIYKNMNMIKREGKVMAKFNAESLFEIKKNNSKGLPQDGIQALPQIASMKKEYYLRYLNDNLRKDVLKLFAHYNPIMNLQNINELTSNDIHAKEQVELLKQEVFGKLEEKINNDYYKKKLEKLQKDHLSNGGTNRDCVVPSEGDKMNKTSSTTFRPMSGFYKGNRKNKKIVSAQKRKLTIKEQREKELESLNDVLEKIDSTLEIDLISNYIGNYQNFKNDTRTEQQEKYFPELETAQKALKRIQSAKLTAKSKEDETKELEERIAYEHRMLMNSIAEGKGKLIYDIFKAD